MLADRHYMKESRGHNAWSVSTILMVVLVATFALQCMDDVYFKTRVEMWLGLTPAWFIFAWQLLTFQFLHFNLWHLVGNLIGLWFFGRFVENVLGIKRFLLAYLGSGVIGGLLQGILMLLFPGHFGAIVFGASAGVSGVFAIFAMLESESEVRLNFILPIRAKTLLGIALAVSAFFTIVPTPRESVAHAAHLGGLLAGITFVRLRWHQDFRPLPWVGLWDRFRGAFHQRPPRRASPRAQSRSDLIADMPIEELTPDFISREVDPILDKISAHGIHSLTERERKILAAARERMSKR